MLTKLNIPAKINVGFQNRSDTYSGKLAFVVYTDSKGVLKKQKSWEGWRDKKIEPKEFENLPTSGFVLNKKVGGNTGGWNPRHTWVRIWDPRDFEFEISVANLLFILQETSAVKGKGLEGEFVYSWDGVELVLLPVNSQEYRSSVEFGELQTKKISSKEMREGCLYLTKDKEQVMYLGRQDWYDLTKDHHDSTYHHYLKQSKLHVFVSVDGKSTYWTQTGFTKLANRLSEEPSPLFAEEFEKFKNSVHGSEPVDLVGKPFSFNGKEASNYGVSCYYKLGNYYFPFYLNYDSWKKQYRALKSKSPVMMTTDKRIIVNHSGGYDRDYKPITSEEIEGMDLYNLCIKNKQGTLIQI